MSTFTPGPWEIRDDYTQDHGVICVEHPAWDAIDVIMPQWSNMDSPEEHQANARLIAAAPDLYDALQECSFRLAALVAASGDFSDVNAKALDAATAALAKAEGRS